MSWQDIVLAVGSVLFMVALLPSIASDHKPAVVTSVMTGMILVVFAVVYASLQLWFTTVVTAVTAVCWLVLFGQGLLANRHSK